MTINQYIADDLANKVIHLYEALNKAQDRISILEEQNALLSGALHDMTLLSKEVYENGGFEQ